MKPNQTLDTSRMNRKQRRAARMAAIPGLTDEQERAIDAHIYPGDNTQDTAPRVAAMRVRA